LKFNIIEFLKIQKQKLLFSTMDSALASKINSVASTLWAEITALNPSFEEFSKNAEVCFFASEGSSNGVYQVSIFSWLF